MTTVFDVPADLLIEKVAEEFDISVNHCQLRVDKAKKQLFSHIKII